MITRVPPGTWETLPLPSSKAAGDTAYQLQIDPRLRVRGRGGQTTDATMVGSIGYLGYGHAEKSKLPMAWLQNKLGEYVQPSLESGQATLNSATLPANLRGWVPDPEGKDSYPIVTYTWLLVHKHDGNSRTTAALKDVLKYCVTDGQKDCVALGYIPLPEKVPQAELQAVDAMAP